MKSMLKKGVVLCLFASLLFLSGCGPSTKVVNDGKPVEITLWIMPNSLEPVNDLEKVLEGWKTIKIYNTIIQQDPKSGVTKKKVEVIATGNCKVYESELEAERYKRYLELRILLQKNTNLIGITK